MTARRPARHLGLDARSLGRTMAPRRARAATAARDAKGAGRRSSTAPRRPRGHPRAAAEGEARPLRSGRARRARRQEPVRARRAGSGVGVPDVPERFGIPRQRWPLAIAMVLLLAFTLSWLQGRFDASDAKKAIAAAMSWRPAGTATMFDALSARGEGDPQCSGKVVSQLLGDVAVSCSTPKTRGSTSSASCSTRAVLRARQTRPRSSSSKEWSRSRRQWRRRAGVHTLARMTPSSPSCSPRSRSGPTLRRPRTGPRRRLPPSPRW